MQATIAGCDRPLTVQNRQDSAPVRRCVQRRWRAMGSDAHLIVVGTAGGSADRRPDLEQLADAAIDRIAELESLWSRFLPTSEISRLNRFGWASVSPETFALIDRAILARRTTSGRFDPLQLRALEQLGYDRPYEDLDPLGRSMHPQCGTEARDRPPPRERADGAGAPIESLPTGCAGIVLDPFSRTVSLLDAVADEVVGHAVAFDAGGIGKGFAADLVVHELLGAGAVGALVNLGGDLRVEGTPPAGASWVIEVGEQAWSNHPFAVLELDRGAVATSTPLRRRWRGASHHLLDPATGRPAADGPAVVTTIAGEGWWAEAAATALAVEPFPESQAALGSSLDLVDVASAVIGFDGAVELAGGFELFARASSAVDDIANVEWRNR